ncbi:MAG TPA: hypothetical protein VHP12_07390 [Chitinophagaceae bacterium]|nr:hypothetical protein [Chitinophagaceae bacterium]
MKKHLLTMAIAIVCMIASQAQTKAPEWKEQKQFYGLISKSFHPAEEGKFDPLKSKADSLAIAAKLWHASQIPSNFKPKETKENLEILVKKCVVLQQAVKENKPDAELKKLITDAHDAFHKIVGECKIDD